MSILTLNCWRNAISYGLFSGDRRSVLAGGTVERVSLGGSYLIQRVPGRKNYCIESNCSDHGSAIALIIATLASPVHGVLDNADGIAGVGHRVVHGGENFHSSVVLDDQILEAIMQLQNVAPLHNASNIAGILGSRKALADIPHVAIFDTAFHLTIPEHAYIYPLPYEWYQKHGVRRYGFHGPSHLYLSRRAATLLCKPADSCNLITIHIERGVSVCAISNGYSVDTSMGMTPLEGAVMDTRSGDIDPGIISFAMQELHLSHQELERVLNQKSGISGITGRHSDRRQMLEAALDNDPKCRLALSIEAYRLKKYIGAYLAAAGPVDAIALTTGTGPCEWLSRELALSGMESFGIRLCHDKNRGASRENREAVISSDNSAIKVFVIPSNEQLVFAEDVAAILSASYNGHQQCDYSFARPDFVPLQPAL